MTPPEISFAKFGTSFQESLVHLIFEDRAFSDQIREVLDVDFLEVKYLRLFLNRMFTHRDKYGTHPSRDAMTTMLRTELDDENEVVVKQVREYYARILSSNAQVKDSDYIKSVSLEFCKKQKLKEALIESADLINRVSATSYDEVRKKIDGALKLGSENNFGYDYLADFERRFELKARNPVTTGWKKIDSITQGGLGVGELGVVIAPTGVGKSMVLVHLGAEALRAGKTVVHYTLELADTVVASRYDSCITGIGLSDLYTRKEEIYEQIKDVEGRLIVKEYPTKTATTATITNHLEKLIARGIKPDMILVDYGDLLRPIDKRKEKRNELESIYEEMRAMAQVYECPVWTASQTNRTGLNAEVITMESISEAFNKCFVADFICTISRTIEDKNTNEGRMFVAKNRNGPDGIVFPIFMETRNVKIKVLERSNETPESLAVGAAKRQSESLKEKYKSFRNGRKAKD
jgi:replicative DNA helicase